MTDKTTTRHSIQVFSEAMEKKLQRDDDVKLPWEIISLRSPKLQIALRAEMVELCDALVALRNPTIGENYEKKQQDVMLECCDVANYAMMIFSLVHPDLKDNIRGYKNSNDLRAG